MTKNPTRMTFITFVEFVWSMEELSFTQKVSLIFKALHWQLQRAQHLS